jgi:hypothetical protein
MMFHILSGGLEVTLHFSKGYTVTKGFDPGTTVLLASLAQGAFLASMLAVGSATAAAGLVILRSTRCRCGWRGSASPSPCCVCRPSRR